MTKGAGEGDGGPSAALVDVASTESAPSKRPSPAKLSVSNFSFSGPRRTPTSSIKVRNSKLKFVKTSLYRKALHTRGPRSGEDAHRSEASAPVPSPSKRRRTVPVSLRIDPPTPSFYSAKGVRVLQAPVVPDPTRKTLLGPRSQKNKHRMTVVLDMDETLLHSSFVNLEPSPPRDAAPHDFGFLIENPEGQELPMWYREVRVWKRAKVDEFLQHLSTFAEIVVFTASQPEYANPLLDVIDHSNIIDYRLCRDQCTNTDHGYIKDLSLLGRPLSRVVILDNCPASFKFHADNGIPISSFYGDRAGDKSDNELMKILPLLSEMSQLSDVRPFLRKRFRMHQSLGDPRTPAIQAADPLEAPGRLDIGAGSNAADDLMIFQDDPERAPSTTSSQSDQDRANLSSLTALNDTLMSTTSSVGDHLLPPSTPGSAQSHMSLGGADSSAMSTSPRERDEPVRRTSARRKSGTAAEVAMSMATRASPPKNSRKRKASKS